MNCTRSDLQKRWRVRSWALPRQSISLLPNPPVPSLSIARSSLRHGPAPARFFAAKLRVRRSAYLASASGSGSRPEADRRPEREHPRASQVALVRAQTLHLHHRPFGQYRCANGENQSPMDACGHLRGHPVHYVGSFRPARHGI